MNSNHAFFNFIASSRKFRIPAPFALEMRGVLGDRVILRDVYENSWEMEVVRDGEYECYFSEGWRQFYIENSLEVGDLMVFEYRANKLFDFQIFGSNACQKKGVGALKANEHHAVKQEYDDDDVDGIHDDVHDDDVGAPKVIEHKVVKEEYDDASMDVDDGIHDDSDDDDDVIRDDGDDDDDVIHDDSDDHDDDYVPKEEEEEEEEELVNTNLEKVAKLKNKSKPPCASNTCEGYMHMDEDAIGEDDVEQLRTTSKTINAKSKSKSSRNSTRGNTPGNGNIPCERIFKKKDLPDCYGADIFRSGMASVPKNPYFVSRSRVARRKNELYIPKDVIVDYGLKISGTMFLVDERGNKWKSKMIKWKDGRLWCTKGWRNLCNVNGINLDDTCICEFVREEGCEEYSLFVSVVGGGLDK